MDEELFIELNCPGCGGTIAFPEHRAGLLEECPVCMGALLVPTDGRGEGKAVPLPIEAPRLRLRRFTQADCEATMMVFNDAAMVEAGCVPCDEAAMRSWIEKESNDRLTQPEEGLQLALELKDGGAIVGFVTLHCVDLDRFQATISAGVMGGRRRQGYATEALRALVEFCLRDLGMHRVAASCESTNTAARCAFERAGLRGEGEFKQDRLKDGIWVNTVYYARLQEELGAAPAPES